MINKSPIIAVSLEVSLVKLRSVYFVTFINLLSLPNLTSVAYPHHEIIDTPMEVRAYRAPGPLFFIFLPPCPPLLSHPVDPLSVVDPSVVDLSSMDWSAGTLVPPEGDPLTP